MDVGIVRADARSAPFFEAAARDVLLVKRCGGCGGWLGPEAGGCASCGDDEPRWEAAAGLGTLVSWAVLPESGGVLGLLELDEGPWLHTRLDCDPAAAVAGLRVAASFVHPDEGESYPVFRPAGG
jgi:uncharacterized protein